MDTLTRRDKCLAAIHPGQGRGVEIGPLSRPFVDREHADVVYVDHLTTAELRAKYRDDDHVDPDAIVDIDVVWGDAPLAEALGGEAFDYVVGSHLVEHVPDLVGWLRETAELLRPGGVLSLVVPDRDFTFDARRPLSTVGEVLDAHRRHADRPSFGQLFDHCHLVAEVDVAAAWAGASPDDAEPVHSLTHAWVTASEMDAEGAYQDCHCWVFTPASFVEILGVVFELDLVDLEVVSFFPTAADDLEFFVSLARVDPALDDEARRARRLASLPSPAEAAGDRGERPDELADLTEAVVRAEARVVELEASTSWRMTRLLRRLGGGVRRP